MTTIKEDYVGFKTAKLLKEKGFDCETDMYYSPEGELKCWIPNGLKSWLGNKGNETWWWKCIAPTIQTAMKWLRIEHNLFIIIDCGVGAYVWSIADMSNGNVILKVDAVVGYYEEACEAAIKYCLENLI